MRAPGEIAPRCHKQSSRSFSPPRSRTRVTIRSSFSSPAPALGPARCSRFSGAISISTRANSTCRTLCGCGISSGGVPSPTLAAYVAGTGLMDGVTTAGGRSYCLPSRRCPQSFFFLEQRVRPPQRYRFVVTSYSRLLQGYCPRRSRRSTQPAPARHNAREASRMSRLLDETLGYGSYQSRCDAIVPSL